MTDDLSELEWTLSFLYDVGQLGSFSIDSDSLRCQSEDQTMLESEIAMEAEAPLPLDHGSIVVSADDSCGGLHLDEFSSMQFFSFSAETSSVTSGSYQLILDHQSTSCIPFDASESQLKAAIQALDYVGDINVIAAPSAEGVFEYTIEFKGDYPFGGGYWPALSVNPLHFGKGDCDPFVGGINHRATILPVRDETTSCTSGSLNTVAIVASSSTPMSGSFLITCGAHHLKESALIPLRLK